MAQTPTWGLPYPEPTTLITDSAAIIQELAEKIDTALSSVTASDSYTVPGTLLADMTTSGTFTPPAGVTLVNVVVIGGGNTGGQGDGGTGSNASWVAGGGAGGEVRVYRNVPVLGDVLVTIGGSDTGSTFGGLVARTAAVLAYRSQAGLSYNAAGCSHGTTRNDYLGRDGVQVNGTYYAGGGGGADGNGIFGTGAPGGAGGGGEGGGINSRPKAGVNGLGGGGGGHRQNGAPGLGGSGRVMVYTEQATMRRNAPTPDPHIVAALDAAGLVLGIYSVEEDDPDLPGVPHSALVPYPADPQDTGRTVQVPDDPADPDGPTHPEPVLEWPTAGWTYDGARWTPPQEVTP